MSARDVVNYYYKLDRRAERTEDEADGISASVVADSAAADCAISSCSSATGVLSAAAGTSVCPTTDTAPSETETAFVFASASSASAGMTSSMYRESGKMMALAAERIEYAVVGSWQTNTYLGQCRRRKRER